MAILNSLNTRCLARGLGWFSVGLGLAETLAPRASSMCAGVAADERLIRLLGLRELITGVGLIAQRKPHPWVWARVAGDVLDLSLLGIALRGTLRGKRKGDTTRAGAVAAAVAGITAIDLLCGERLRREAVQTFHVEDSFSLNCSPDEAYGFWKDFESFPHYMEHLHSVRVIDETHSRWVARGPGGILLEWESELSTDVPGELISWHSIEGSDVVQTGSVRFASASRGNSCKVHVNLRFSRPVGENSLSIGRLVGKAFESQIRKDLRRFKEGIERGEVSTKEHPVAVSQ